MGLAWLFVLTMRADRQMRTELIERASLFTRTIDPGVINASVPVGTDYCGPDITAVFFERLKLMSSRLAALPDSERGVFDGTLFLARNGTNMDFVTGSLKDPVANTVCLKK